MAAFSADMVFEELLEEESRGRFGADKPLIRVRGWHYVRAKLCIKQCARRMGIFDIGHDRRNSSYITKKRKTT